MFIHEDCKICVKCFSTFTGKHLYWYGCWFVAKLSWKKNFFWKKRMFFIKYTLFAEKMFLYEKKSFILKTFFTEKNIFYREKYKWKCKIYIYIIWKYIFMQKMFVLQIKYKSFLNIFILQNFLIIKNIFVKTSLWTQQSGP